MDRVKDILLVARTFQTDSIGQKIAVETTRSLLGTLKSISRSEWVAANQLGFQPTITAVISELDYQNEEIVQIDSERYVVYRTYFRNDGMVELMLHKKAGEPYGSEG